MNPVAPELMKILACPACEQRPALSWDEERQKLVCDACGRFYPVRDGIPVLLVEEAERPDAKL